VSNIKEIIVYSMNYPPAAKEFRDAVYENLQLIGENPYMYGVPDNLPGFLEMGYRKAPVYKHQIILYLIEGETVHVIYVVDTRQNLWMTTPI
jgi:plasmid stabilization system protein ParE